MKMVKKNLKVTFVFLFAMFVLFNNALGYDSDDMLQTKLDAPADPAPLPSPAPIEPTVVGPGTPRVEVPYIYLQGSGFPITGEFPNYQPRHEFSPDQVQQFKNYYQARPQDLPNNFEAGSAVALSLGQEANTANELTTSRGYTWNAGNQRFQRPPVQDRPLSEVLPQAADTSVHQFTVREIYDIGNYYGAHTEALPDTFAPGSAIAYGLGQGTKHPDHLRS